MQPPDRIASHLLLLGGGHAHISVLRSFGMRPLSGLKITLVSPSVTTPYSGMLPGFVAGHYSLEEMHLDLVSLCRFAGADLVLATADGLDADQQRVDFADRPPITFDLLSVNVGIAPGLDDLRLAPGRGIPVKPISRFVERFLQLDERLRGLTATGEEVHLGVVGAGAGGVELCLALNFRYRHLPVHCHLFTDGTGLLEGHGRRVQARMRSLLQHKGIRLHTGFRAVELDDRRLIASSGEQVELEEALLVTSAAAPGWLRDSALALDEEGYIQVSRTLQSVSHPKVFAAGDVAQMLHSPRPKAGVFAVRQGPVLARNLRRLLLNRKPLQFRPQRRFLSLLASGDRHAVAAWGQLALSGTWVWHWKRWIDQRFMQKFSQLPEMTAAPRPREGLRVPGVDDSILPCAGCGAKVAGGLLADVLRELPVPPREDVTTGLASLDDAAVSRLPEGQLLVHSVDSLRAFTGDAYRFGRIATLHALSDLFAMAARPQTATVIATLPYAVSSYSSSLLRQLMAGVVEELQAHDTALVGGHTSEGVELSLGLAVNGHGRPEQLLLKSGARAGDLLLLTKPLGVGVILAAEMRGKARGEAVEGAMQTMLLSNLAAAELLSTYGATACTDVTGFGLAGHLLEMLRASGMGAELYAGKLPVLPDAVELSASGIASSLYAANAGAGLYMHLAGGTGRDARYPLLFDPQTSGGLLAAVPECAAGACLEALQLKGMPEAACVGRIVAEHPAQLTVLA